MTKLKAFSPSLDGIEKELHAYYREEPDVGYVLDAEEADGWAVANVSNATSGVQAARREAAAAKKELAAAKAERERLSSMVAQLEADIEAATEGKFDRKAVEEQITKKLERTYQAQMQAIAAERDERAKALAALESEHHSTLIDREIASAASSGKWSFSPKVLKSTIAGRMRVAVDESGARKIEYLDANGEPRVGMAGKSPSIDDILSEFSRDADYAAFVTRKDQQPPKGGSDARGGGGSNRGASGPVVITRDMARNFSEVQRLEAEAKEAGRQVVYNDPAFQPQ